MAFGVLYVLAWIGRIDIDALNKMTGVVAVLFFVSNVYWYLMRK
jgi:preprotein translocase subunit SecG